jgi:hypothetical protein
MHERTKLLPMKPAPPVTRTAMRIEAYTVTRQTLLGGQRVPSPLQ